LSYVRGGLRTCGGKGRKGRRGKKSIPGMAPPIEKDRGVARRVQGCVGENGGRAREFCKR